jgi:hypothetical protein
MVLCKKDVTSWNGGIRKRQKHGRSENPIPGKRPAYLQTIHPIRLSDSAFFFPLPRRFVLVLVGGVGDGEAEGRAQAGLGTQMRPPPVGGFCDWELKLVF